MEPALAHPLPMEYADRAPSVPEVQVAIDLVLTYLDQRDRDMRLISAGERTFLRTMKGIFYQLASGDPVDRQKLLA